jgi:hypothetical protein
VAFYNVWQSGSTPVLIRTPITVKANGQLVVVLPTLTTSDTAFSVYPAP